METSPPLEQPSQQRPAYQQQPNDKQRSSGGLLAIVVVVAVIAFAGSMLLNLLLLAVVAGQGIAGQDSFMEREVSGSGPDKVLHLQLDGIITSGKEDFAPFISDRHVLRMLDQAEEDTDIKGVILEINSPGGTVTASDKIAMRIRRLRKAGKRAYVLMGDICASGGVYIATAADKVYAHPTTITGSIGVIIRTYNLQALMRTIGVRDVTFKSGAMKDLLSMYRQVTSSEQAVVQDIIDGAYNRFIALVSEGRGIPADQVRGFADGRIFNADRALELKLIDSIGYFDNVLVDLKSDLGLSKARVVTYYRPFSLMALTQGHGGQPDLLTGLAIWLSQPTSYTSGSLRGC